jgi:hypothetical protein
MGEARPNDGSPYIAGHLAGSTEQTNLLGQMLGTTMVVKGVPHETFAAADLQIAPDIDATGLERYARRIDSVHIARWLRRRRMGIRRSEVSFFELMPQCFRDCDVGGGGKHRRGIVADIVVARWCLDHDAQQVAYRMPAAISYYKSII